MAISFAERLTRRVDRMILRLEQLETSINPNGKRIQRLRTKINGFLNQLGLPPLEDPTPPGLSDGPAFSYGIPEGFVVTSGTPHINDGFQSDLGLQGFRFQVTSTTPVNITHFGTAVLDNFDYEAFYAPTTVTLYDENMDPIIGSTRPRSFDPTIGIGNSQFWQLEDPITLQPYRTYTLLQTVDKSERYLLTQIDQSGDNLGQEEETLKVVEAVQTDDWLKIEAPVGINNWSGTLPASEAWWLSFSSVYLRGDDSGLYGAGSAVTVGPNMLATAV